MIIVKFFSGIGNQLYQYAVYLRLKQQYPNQIIKADLSTFEDHELLNKGNGFSYGFGMKEFFGIEIEPATKEEIDAISYEVHFGQFYRKHFPGFVKKNVGVSRLAVYRARLLKKYGSMKERYITNVPFDAYTGYIDELDTSQDYYVSGLWQNYKFIKPIERELRENLRFKIEMTYFVKDLLSKINGTQSVCIHVRRGDFTSSVNKYTHDLCKKQYYEEGIRLLQSKLDDPYFFVFSDEIDYCKGLFSDLDNIIYVSDDKKMSTQQEMYLMSQCKSAIIANSTFAFWAVWITDNTDKLVVAPKYSVREKNIWHMFSLPEHWMIVDNLEGDFS